MIKKFFIIAIFAFTIIFSYMYKVNATTNGEYMSEYLATVKYEQKNGFTKDKINDSYYSQEYNIYIDNVEIQSYRIDIIEGFPEGTFVANINTGEKQEEFGLNETKFKIMVPADKAEEDFIGKFKAYMDFRSYTTYYTSEGNLLTMDVSDSKEQFIKFDNRHSSLKINVIDAETLKGINGVTIQVKDNAFQLTSELVTDKSGKALVDKIGRCKASIKVINVPNEYVITGIEEQKEIGYKENSVYNLELKRKKGSLCIENNAINSIFEIYNSKGVLVGKYPTDDDGLIEIDELDIGNYLLIQKQLPKGYLPVEDQIFTIYDGQISYLFIMNEMEEIESPNEDNQDKVLEEGNSSKDELDRNPEKDEPEDNEQDKELEETKPNEDNLNKAPEEKPNEDEQTKKPQNGGEPEADKNNNIKEESTIQDDTKIEESKEDSNKTPTIKGEENISNDKYNNSKEQEQDNEKETNNKSSENEKDTKTDIIDKQSSIDKVNLSTLPRTGDDYFLVKVILLDIFIAVVFLLIINHKKQSAKKQTAFDIKE